MARPAPAQLEAATDLARFIDASPSPFHAVAEASRRLDAAGFERLLETDTWAEQARGRRYVVRDGSLVAWTVPPSASEGLPLRLVGAHTDSPNLRVKPRPDRSTAGARHLAVEPYGGVLLNSWLGRDLGLSGRVALRSGELRLLRVDRPILHLPQLAIHLDRSITTDGLKVDPQHHIAPIWGVGADALGFRDLVADEVGCDAGEIVAWDVMTHDLAPSTLAGRDDDLLSAPRLDNLCSAWAAVESITAATDVVATSTWPVIALFDHEEVGSETHRGASSTWLEQLLRRIVAVRPGADHESFARAMAASTCVSSDMAHATHPNYTDRHEPGHWIALDGGPVVKTNVNQRYATDARSAGPFVAACERAGVPVQWYAHRADIPCGSTIGPVTAARLGIPTVDVGVAQLAMHSVRELCGAADPALFTRALTAWLDG